MKLDVNLDEAKPIGTLATTTYYDRRPYTETAASVDTPLAHAARAAVRDAVQGVDFLTHSVPNDGKPVQPGTIRFTLTDARGATKSLSITGSDEDVARFDALGSASEHLIEVGFGLAGV